MINETDSMFELIGAIHLPPFVGDKVDSCQLEQWLMRNVRAHYDGGFRSLILQDQTPGEHASLKTITYMTAFGKLVKDSFPDLSLGIIVEANDPEAALHIANASSADFIRIKVYVGAMVKAGGIIHGCAARALAVKNQLDHEIKIYTDIYDRTGSPLGNIPLATAVQHAVKYGSDGLILTGENYTDTLGMISDIKSKVTTTKIFVGGGINYENISDVKSRCNGAIVSSCLMVDGCNNEWDKEKITSLVGSLQRLSRPQGGIAQTQ